jgi:hypothetical protein
MLHHKFSVGENVTFLPSIVDYNVPAGTYRIVRQMPMEAGGFTYRVKSVNDGQERVMRESQLFPADRDS